MIRTKDKIIAEPNDPDTVILSGYLSDNKVMLGAGNKSIKCGRGFSNELVLLASNKQGQLRFIQFNNKANVVIGTDANGEITLYDRSAIE